MNKEYNVKWMERKETSTGKSYIKATLEGVDGTVSIWSDFLNFANIAPGSNVTGELKKNDKGYLNLYPPKAERPQVGTFRGQSGGFKTAQAKELMQDKNNNIKEAQDRSAWMWAKTNASTLIAGWKGALDGKISVDEISEMVIRLATQIYNGEPIEPFTSRKPVEDTPPLDSYEADYNAM